MDVTRLSAPVLRQRIFLSSSLSPRWILRPRSTRDSLFLLLVRRSKSASNFHFPQQLAYNYFLLISWVTCASAVAVSLTRRRLDISTKQSLSVYIFSCQLCVPLNVCKMRVRACWVCCIVCLCGGRCDSAQVSVHWLSIARGWGFTAFSTFLQLSNWVASLPQWLTARRAR